MHDTVSWHERAQAFKRDVRPFINGELIDVRTGSQAFTQMDPVTGQHVHDYGVSGQTEVDRAVASARIASGQWLEIPPMARKQILQTLGELIHRDADVLALCDSLEMGKPIGAAQMEAHIAASLFQYFGEAIDKVYTGQTVPTDAGSFEMHLRRPRGVVAAITPWNYPVINAALKTAPALAAGNAVILKPSELTPSSALHIAGLAQEAGLPDGVLNVLPGGGTAGEALVRHAGVDMIAFTGSTATGRALMQASGDSFIKPLQLECGGKSPELVFADAASIGIQAMAQSIVGGACANQGQLCVARTRLLIEDSIYDDLLNTILEIIVNVKPGHPLDPDTQFGPLASVVQKRRVESYIKSGLDSGANLLVDGRNPAGFEEGCFVGPCVFTGVDPKAKIAQEEIFGPVLSIFRFQSESEAVQLANDSQYGLAATIWTTDLARAHRLSTQVQAGKIQISATAEPRQGSGWSHESEPCRQSGFGVEGGRLGIEAYTRLQAVDIRF